MAALGATLGAVVLPPSALASHDDYDITLETSAAEIVEGNSGTQTVTMTARLDPPQEYPVELYRLGVYASASGAPTASRGVDYATDAPIDEETPPYPVIEAGETSRTFTFEIFGDSEHETDEAIHFGFYYGTGGPDGLNKWASAETVIFNDDPFKSEVSLVSGPPSGSVVGRQPTWEFASSLPGVEHASTFVCSINTAFDLRPCDNPWRPTFEEDGAYTVWVLSNGYGGYGGSGTYAATHGHPEYAMRIVDPDGDGNDEMVRQYWELAAMKLEFTVDASVDARAEAARLQRVSRASILDVAVTSKEPVEAAAAGAVVIKKPRRGSGAVKTVRIPIHAPNLSVEGAETLGLTAVGGRGKRLIRNAIDAGRRARARIGVGLTDAYGNVESSRLEVGLRPRRSS